LLLAGLIPFGLGQNMHLLHYSEANGLPSQEVRHIARDTFGLVWVATDNGLVRFDGTAFADYSQHVPSRYGQYFCQTEAGILYSHDAGISLIQPGLDTAHITLFREASIDPGARTLYYPNRLFAQSNGDLWISQPDGRIYRISQGKTSLVYEDASQRKDPSWQAFWVESASGALWMLTSSGSLFWWNPQAKTLQERATLPGSADLKVRDQELWIASDRIYRYQLAEDGKSILKQESFASPLGELTALAPDAKGNLFLGIKTKGLYYLDLIDGPEPEFVRIFANNDPHSLDELPFRHIHHLLLDAEGKLWVCAAEGLGILQKRFFESISAIPNANTTAMAVADNGKVFVSFGDLYTIESTDFGYGATPLNAVGLGTVTALTTAGERLWTGSSTGLLHELSHNGRKLRSLDLRERGEGIYFLEHDQENRLWVGQAPRDKPLVGIACILPDGILKEYGPPEGLENRLTCLRETPQGRLYAGGIGEFSYLYRYLPEKDAFVNLSIPPEFFVKPNFQVHDLAIDDQGAIWLASTDGLLRYDMDRIRKMDLGPAYQDAEVKSVVCLPDGSIWAALDTDGLLCYQDDVALVMGEESGLPSAVMSYRGLITDQQWRLWVGTAEGLVYSQAPHPALWKSKRPWLVSGFIDGTRQSLESLILFPDQTLTLHFVAPAFHGFQTHYQFQINGGAWSEPFSRGHLSLDNLSPADYRIGIRARKEGAYRWSDVVFAQVRVAAYWYERPMVWGLLVALILLSFLVLWWAQKRKLRQTRENLGHALEEEQEELKKQEADLSQVRAEMRLLNRESKANLLILEILHRLITKISPTTQWEAMLEIISQDLLKLPGVVAFEIGLREGTEIHFEGYSEHKKDFFTFSEAFDPDTSLGAKSMVSAKAQIVKRLGQDGQILSRENEKRLAGHESAICVPFFVNNKNAVFAIYADQEDWFDEFTAKAMEVFTAYLEQII
jgi:ligand-binding sensor domain-containing protein